MINEKRFVKNFKRKYNVKKVSKDILCSIIEQQGYTIIPFSRFNNNDKIEFLINSLEITEYINSNCCFVYQNDKYRLLFLNSELSEEEVLIVLAHEEGHIWHNHMVSGAVFGSDVRQEFEANEFAHYLLLDYNGRKREIAEICTFVVVLLFLCAIAIGIYKSQHDKSVFIENYYRTESGTKYHLKGCIYLKNRSGVRNLTKEEFDSGEYEPCAVCIQFEDKE